MPTKTTPKQKPRVALVHEYLTNYAGSEQVLLALHELFPEAPIYTALYYPDRVRQFAGANIRVSFLQRWPRFLEKVITPLLPLAVESYDLSSYDLVISDSHIAAKGVITKPETVHICYCHAPTRYAWSPALDPRANKSFLHRLAAHYLRLWDWAASKRVDYWIANSNYIAGRIKKYYRAEATVIHPPVAIDQLKPLEGEIKNYYVLFSRLIDYKRPELVVQAFNRLGKKLIVLGRGSMLPELKAIAEPNIEFIDQFLPIDRLNKVLGEAAGIVYPAEEDFGIAMVDAMACGRPVLAYGVGGARDIIEPGINGQFFNEQSVDSIVEAVGKFQPLSYDKAKIRSRAEQFSRDIFKARISRYIEDKLGTVR